MGIPADGVRVYGGFADIARWLTRKYRDPQCRPLSRQQVYIWYTKRTRNDFPEGEAVTSPSGRVTKRFPRDEVEAWYAGYVPPRGGNTVNFPAKTSNKY